MFEALGAGMTALINWCYGITVYTGVPSFGLAIILVTVAIKVALHPLTRIQLRSMAQMSQLQPEIKKIQDAYGNDKQKMQQKIMELYKERKVNPMSGCLLLLVQLPILIALYRALFNFNAENIAPAHLRFFWVPDLTAQPGVVVYDPAWTIVVLPLLAVATTYFQSKLSMALSAGSGNPGQVRMQRMMLTIMPLFVGYITYIVPAGLGLYWVTFNLVGIVQQAAINKQMLPAKVSQAQKAGDKAETPAESARSAPAAVEAGLAQQPAGNPAKRTSAKGRRGKPGKEEVAQGEGRRRKRKKR